VTVLTVEAARKQRRRRSWQRRVLTVGAKSVAARSNYSKYRPELLEHLIF